MVRVAEAALQVWGRAGEHQQPGAKVAARVSYWHDSEEL